MRRKNQRRKIISKRIKTGNKKSLVSRKKKQIPETEIWDKNLGFEENYKKIGIMTNINKEIDKVMEESKGGKIEVDEEVDVGDLNVGKLVLEPVDKFHENKLKMNLDEKFAIEKLVKRYKEDFNKMVKDIKINKFQWNMTQLKKVYNKYIKIYGDFLSK